MLTILKPSNRALSTSFMLAYLNIRVNKRKVSCKLCAGFSAIERKKPFTEGTISTTFKIYSKLKGFKGYIDFCLENLISHSAKLFRNLLKPKSAMPCTNCYHT